MEWFKDWLKENGIALVFGVVAVMIVAIVCSSVLTFTAIREETKRQAVEKGAVLCPLPTGGTVAVPRGES